MKKLLIVLAVVTAFMFSAPAFAAYDHYMIYVYANKGFQTATGGYTARATGITYKVLQRDTNTAATLYSDAGTTSKDNPCTVTTFDATGRIDFYVDGDTYTMLDIIIVDTVGGFTHTLKDATKNTRTAIIDERLNVLHTGTIWFTADTTGCAAAADVTDGTFSSDGTMDTGIDFLPNTMLMDCNILVVTVTCQSTQSDLAVGIGSDLLSYGLFAGMDLGGAGYFYQDGTNVTSGCQTIGYYFRGTEIGVLPTIQCLFLKQNYVTNSSVCLTYSISSAEDAPKGQADGYINYVFMVLK